MSSVVFSVFLSVILCWWEEAIWQGRYLEPTVVQGSPFRQTFAVFFVVTPTNMNGEHTATDINFGWSRCLGKCGRETVPQSRYRCVQMSIAHHGRFDQWRPGETRHNGRLIKEVKKGSRRDDPKTLQERKPVPRFHKERRTCSQIFGSNKHGSQRNALVCPVTGLTKHSSS